MLRAFRLPHLLCLYGHAREHIEFTRVMQTTNGLLRATAAELQSGLPCRAPEITLPDAVAVRPGC